MTSKSATIVSARATNVWANRRSRCSADEMGSLIDASSPYVKTQPTRNYLKCDVIDRPFVRESMRTEDGKGLVGRYVELNHQHSGRLVYLVVVGSTPARIPRHFISAVRLGIEQGQGCHISNDERGGQFLGRQMSGTPPVEVEHADPNGADLKGDREQRAHS